MCIDFGSDIKVSLFKLVKEFTGGSLFKLLNLDYSDIQTKMFFNDTRDTRYSVSNTVKRSGNLTIQGEINWDAKNYPPAYEYLKSRKVSDAFIKEFSVGYTLESYIKWDDEEDKEKGTPYFNRICIPIFENKKLVSIEGRDFTRRARAKVLYPRGAQVQTLFNVDNLKRKEPLYLVEGMMDVATVWQNISHNVTTCFGVSLSQRQKSLLSDFDNLVVIPDNDKAGLDFLEKLDEWYDKPWWIALLNNGDPNDTPVAKLRQSCANPIESTEYFLNNSQLFKEKELSFW